MPRLGSAKLYHILKYDLLLEGVDIGRDKFHSMLKHLCLLVAIFKKRILMYLEYRDLKGDLI